MKSRTLFWLQLAFTLVLCAFLIGPVLLSVAAGVTENYFLGITSGITVRWVMEVLALYMDTIYLSL